MKKLLLISLILIIGLTGGIYAAPGDMLVDRTKAIWLIATHNTTYPDGIIDRLLDSMAVIPDAYVTSNDVQEWANWMKFDISLTFGGKIFHESVYTSILYTVEGYNYGDPRIQAEHASPICAVVGTNIECDEDPTSAGRGVLLWRYVGGEFVEQDPVASGYTITLDAGTWTIGPLPSVGNLVIAYDGDEFSSFPTLFMVIP